MYFKTIYLDHLDARTLERNLRKVAAKRLSSLDISSSVSDIKSDKLFLGYEKKYELQFTRLRYSFERIFPKLIIAVGRIDEGRAVYRVRLAWISQLVFLAILVGFLFGMYNLFNERRPFLDYLQLLLLPCLFFLLLKVEMRRTENRIKKALKNDKTC